MTILAALQQMLHSNLRAREWAVTGIAKNKVVRTNGKMLVRCPARPNAPCEMLTHGAFNQEDSSSGAEDSS